jgi:hypothetical protein
MTRASWARASWTVAGIAVALPSLQCGAPYAEACASAYAQWGGVVNARFHDPRLIALETVDGRALVPAGAQAAGAELQSGTVGEWVTATYSARLVREASGALAVEWDTDLPMPYGRRVELVAADGTFHGVGVPPGRAALLGFPGALGRPDFDSTLCTWLDSKARFKWGRGYEPEVTTCDTWPDWQPVPRSVLRFRISTPWSNVVAVSHDTRDNVGDNAVCSTHRKSEVLFPASTPASAR